jgi:glutamate synthase (NADPH/NADH) large chain
MGPGQMIALDLQTATLLENDDIDQLLKSRHPYKVWLKKGVRYLESDLIDPSLAAEPMDTPTLNVYRKMFNITAEEREEIIRVLARDESEAVGSMGDDTPMPVLSHHTRNLYRLFPQQFAQVTNPPIDPLRESIVMSLQTEIGPECNIFQPVASHAVQIVLNSPVLSQRKLRQIMALADEGVPNRFIDLQYAPEEGLEAALRRVCQESEAAVRDGALVLLISDRYLVEGRLPIHALLATGAIHNHLVHLGLRCRCNLLIETGTVRDPHHFACLIGYGATAVYPYMAYQSLFDMMRKGKVKLDSGERMELGRSYRKAIRKGLMKIISKMGISTIASYRSGHLFEIVGLGDAVVALCFHGDQPDKGRQLRGSAGRQCAARRARVEPAAAGGAGRPAQVRAWRRIPHVQPGRDRDAAGRGQHRELRDVPAVRAAGERAPRVGAARSARAGAGGQAGAA